MRVTRWLVGSPASGSCCVVGYQAGIPVQDTTGFMLVG